jgi:hypothetical protein
MSDAEKSLREGNKTLQERGSNYGPYGGGISIRDALMLIIEDAHKAHHDMPMKRLDKQRFWDVCNKLCRLAITPKHLDSWHDLGNYAHLIEADLKDIGEGI